MAKKNLKYTSITAVVTEGLFSMPTLVGILINNSHFDKGTEEEANFARLLINYPKKEETQDYKFN